MNLRTYNAGEIVFEEGEVALEGFRIVSGKVEISVEATEGTRSLAQLREGEIFGEMGLVAEKPRSATATALERTTLAVISAENFVETVLKDERELGRYVATLMERLRTTDALLEIALRQNQEKQRPAAVEQGGARAPGAVDQLPASYESALGLDVSRASPSGGHGISALRVVLVSAYERSRWAGKPVAVEIESFPYRIGCKFVGPAPPFMRNDLRLEDTMPGYISRDHCAIERNADTIYMRDRGSVAGTIVNGQPIGTAAGVVTAPLNLGENVVVFGGTDSPHRFFLHVVAVE
ncbi:MAG: cyclic nucleotide-binding domain-containing protein [Verrucomicrobiales bacterium]